MSAVALAADEVPFTPDRHLERALILLCELSERAIDDIWEAQNEHKLSFADAAVRLGYVTEADVAAAIGRGNKLAVIEKRPLKPAAEVLIAHDPFHAHSEKIRALRMELLLRHEGGHANMIAVMSPGRGEGRSLMAAELAIAFSQLGQSTLLVDADLRRPRQHLLFGADNQHGLTDAVTSGDSPYVHPVEHLPHLSVVTSGPTSPNPVELLSDGRFESLIDHWRRRYEHVVIDTSPVAEFSDGLAVATLAGRVLTLSRAPHTPLKANREMLRRLGSTHARILGAAINHF